MLQAAGGLNSTASTASNSTTTTLGDLMEDAALQHLTMIFKTEVCSRSKVSDKMSWVEETKKEETKKRRKRRKKRTLPASSISYDSPCSSTSWSHGRHASQQSSVVFFFSSLPPDVLRLRGVLIGECHSSYYHLTEFDKFFENHVFSKREVILL